MSGRKLFAQWKLVPVFVLPAMHTNVQATFSGMSFGSKKMFGEKK